MSLYTKVNCIAFKNFNVYNYYKNNLKFKILGSESVIDAAMYLFPPNLNIHSEKERENHKTQETNEPHKSQEVPEI